MSYKPIKGYDFTKPPKTIEMIRLTNEERARYDRRSYRKPYEDKPFGILVNNQLLCCHSCYMDRSRLTPTLDSFTEDAAIECIRAFKQLDQEYPYEVCHFEYNGFMGKSDSSKIMFYRARFKCWSGDPGIAVMDCSDGERRLIPTYAMKWSFATLPNDMTRAESDGEPVFFGPSSEA